MQQSGTPDQRPVLEDQRTVNQSSVKCSDESRSRTDKAPLDLSSILGSIGSIDKIASITEMLKSSNQTSSDNQNQSCNNQPTQNITRYLSAFKICHLFRCSVNEVFDGLLTQDKDENSITVCPLRCLHSSSLIMI